MAASANTSDHDFVVMGSIIKPHGIKGELCALIHADSPSLLLETPAVFLLPPKGQPLSFAVLTMRMHKGRVLITLKEVPDRNRAEELRGYKIAVLREDLPEAEQGQNYLHDILGFEVCLEDGTELGIFTNFIETSATEVWIIKHPKGEIMLPAIDEVILNIDTAKKRITVRPPEGLLDIYLGTQEKK